jgi:hypothetical protein
VYEAKKNAARLEFRHENKSNVFITLFVHQQVSQIAYTETQPKTPSLFEGCQIKLYMSHAPNTTSVDFPVKCLL